MKIGTTLKLPDVRSPLRGVNVTLPMKIGTTLKHRAARPDEGERPVTLPMKIGTTLKQEDTVGFGNG